MRSLDNKELEDKLEFYKSVITIVFFFCMIFLAFLIPITLTNLYHTSSDLNFSDITTLVLLCLILITILFGIISIYRYNKRQK